MAIKDIKFMNGEGYLLKDLSLSLETYEAQMKQIDYDCIYDQYRGCRDEFGVEKTQFPSIIFAFYNIVFSLGKVPTPEELLDEYYRLNNADLFIDGDAVVYQNRSFRKIDLDARILRTYPSLVRDHHFYLMLAAEHCFDRVIYSCKNDISGKDLIVQHKGKEYFISLFVKTKRSTFFKQIKNTFRHIYSRKEIPLPLELDAAKKCGDFFVYDQGDLQQVKYVILKKRTPFLRK
jgi:hypothetical protein